MTKQQANLLLAGIIRCKEILAVDPTAAKPRWVGEAVFVLLMVNLKDVLTVLDTLGKRVSFKGDLPDGLDLTDAVFQMRNAVCHLGSEHRRMMASEALLHFGTQKGKGVLLETAGRPIFENPYADDLAIFYGDKRLLWFRHIHRAVGEAASSAKALAEAHGHDWPLPQ